jgi:glycosyltransferase involved in cell wall biosynthesis
LHYTSPSVLGGVEQVMGAHATALLAAGARVTIVAGRGRAVPRGVRMVRIPEVSSTHPAVLRDLRTLARGEVTPEHARLVTRLVRALEPVMRDADVLVAHNVLTMHKSLALVEALAHLARTVRTRMIAWTHDIAWIDARYATERHPGPPWDLIARPLPRVRYVAVSVERVHELKALFGRETRVDVVSNGIDLAARLGLSPAGARLAERLGLYDADPLLLLPARLTRRKRIEVAIDALAALRTTSPRAALVITGSPGPHNVANREYAEQLAQRAARTNGVHLLDALRVRVTDRVMSDLFALADAVVLPSEAEGFGIPVLEAGAHGVPVICSQIRSLEALAGNFATYVPPDADGRTIAAAVEARLRDDRVAGLRRRAKQHAWGPILRDQVVPLVLGTKWTRPGSTFS